jgi:hypothetical protein
MNPTVPQSLQEMMDKFEQRIKSAYAPRLAPLLIDQDPDPVDA